MNIKTQPTRKIIVGARNLQAGDRLFSKASETYLTVTKVENRLNKTIVLFDEDREIDFDPYYQLEVYRNC